MAWEPESFTPEERRCAAKALVRAQALVDRLDRDEFGEASADVVRHAYSRVDDLLAMLYDDLYGLDESNPQWPSAS